MSERVGDMVMPSERASSYISLLQDFLPLYGLAFSILVLKGLRGVRASYTGSSFLAKFGNIVLSSVIGASLAVACAVLLPLTGIESNDTIMVGVTVFMAIGGMRLVDACAYKYLGLRIIDISESSSVESQWGALSQADKEEALRLWNKAQEGEE